MIRSETWIRLFFSLLFTYLFGVGATFNGVLTPVLQRFTLVLITIMVVMWIGIRWRTRWQWHRTPLDAVVILWALAFCVSLLANQETWRRSMMGLWYAGVYVGAWYVMYDAIANRALKWDTFLDGVMFGGLIVLVFSGMQVFQSSVDLANFELPRPGGTIGNPNSLGTFLIILLSLSTARFFDTRQHLARIVIGFYSLVTFSILFLTFSRGAWIGAAAMISTMVLMILYARGLLSVQRIRNWWRELQPRFRKSVIATMGLAIISVGVIAFLLAQSVGAAGRSPGLRLRIYENALQIIGEKPLTGHGLFTFGQELARMQSEPPRFPHSHAHNIALHVQAELGVIGSIALLSTVGLFSHRAWRAWRTVQKRYQMELVGVIAAAVGLGVHLMLDTTVMMPVIALIGLLVLVRAVMPYDPVPVTIRWQQLAGPVVLVGIWIALLVTGFWSSNVYAGYFDALVYASPEEGPIDYRGAAERIQPAIDADPDLAVYHSQQAYLYGMAANEGDSEALSLAIAGFQRFLELEPHHATAWANLAALYWQDSQRQQAIEAMEQAQSLASLSYRLGFQLGQYLELTGLDEQARTWYRQSLNATTRLWPGWDKTPITREIAAEYLPEGDVALVLAMGSPQRILSALEAEGLWIASDLDADDSVRELALRIILITRSNIDEDVLTLVEQADEMADGNEDRAWVHLAWAELSRSEGDVGASQRHISEVRTLLEHDIGRGDTPFGGNIAVFQFLRLAYPRQFLPQVGFPAEDPALLYLLEAFQAID